jgi:hypothetical protein
VIPNRKPDEIGIVFSMKHFHYPVLVKRYCAETNVEDGTNILHPFSFCQQMQDWTLPLGQPSYLFHAPPVLNTAHVSKAGELANLTESIRAGWWLAFLVRLLAKNPVSNNVGDVKHSLSTPRHALREERHFVS